MIHYRERNGLTILTGFFWNRVGSFSLFRVAYAKSSINTLKLIAANPSRPTAKFPFRNWIKKSLYTETFLNIVGGERTAELALTSFLRDVECAKPVGILVGFFFGLWVSRSWDVEEGVGAARLAVLAGRRSPSSWRLAPDLRRRFGLGQPWLWTVPGSSLPIQLLLLLLLSAVPHRPAPCDAGRLRPGRGPPARRWSGLQRSREGFHTRGSRRAYRLRALRTSVRSHSRDDTGTSPPTARAGGLVASRIIRSLLF